MKFVALISGGKDSIYNIIECIKRGHTLECVGNLCPKQKDNEEIIAETDSYMFQTIGYNLIEGIGECLEVPVYQASLSGRSINVEMNYSVTENDEIEDMYKLILRIKKEHPEIEGVSVGAVLSNYQRIRVENVCSRLCMTPLCYLWERDQCELLDEMIECNMNAILVKTAALGLIPEKHLNKTIEELRDDLHELNKKYGVNVCGEGGEYESLTLDCPIYHKRIIIDEGEISIYSKHEYDCVGHYIIKKFHLEDKLEKDIIPIKPIEIPNNPRVKDLHYVYNKEHNIKINISSSTINTDNNNTDVFNIRSKDDLMNVSFTSSTTNEKLFDLFVENCNKNNMNINDIISIHFYLCNIDNYYSNMIDQFNEVFDKSTPTITILEHRNNHSIIEAIFIKKSSIHLNPAGMYPGRGVLRITSQSSYFPRIDEDLKSSSQATNISGVIYSSSILPYYCDNMIITEDYTINHCNRIIDYIKNMLKIMYSKINNSIEIVIYISEKGSDSIKDYSELIDNVNEILNNTSIPVVYIVVPKLPKCASIQIECINMMNWVYEQLPPTYISKTVDLESGCNCIINGIYNPISYLSLKIDVVVPPNTVLDFESLIVKNVISVVDTMVKESKFSLDDVVSIRYYYLHNVIDNIFVNYLPYPYNKGIGISTNYIPCVLSNINVLSITLTTFDKGIIDKHILV